MFPLLFKKAQYLPQGHTHKPFLPTAVFEQVFTPILSCDLALAIVTPISISITNLNDRHTIVTRDASDRGAGAVLTQIQAEGQE